MARSPANLYASNSITASKTEVVAAVTGTTRIIRKVTFQNHSGGVLTIDLYIDPDGASEVQILDTYSIADAETYTVADAEGHILTSAGTIDATASGAGVGLLISGIEVV